MPVERFPRIFREKLQAAWPQIRDEGLGVINLRKIKAAAEKNDDAGLSRSFFGGTAGSVPTRSGTKPITPFSRTALPPQTACAAAPGLHSSVGRQMFAESSAMPWAAS
ncbi:hypothetical protein ACU4HD_47000 [Cupriavidus basilensis]